VQGSRVAQVFAQEWPVLLATLRRDLGDLDLAEDAAQDAFVEAAARWGPGTTPERPGAWLLTTARRRAIDRRPSPTWPTPHPGRPRSSSTTSWP
jgi:RNA polymerase sigma-70 factor (ECF subfamily)